MKTEQKVVVAHNHYGNFAFGGEATVVRQEIELLRQNGWNVKLFEKTNFEMRDWSIRRKLLFPFQMGRSEEIYREAVALFREFKPKILHAHNYKFVLTSAIFEAAKDCGLKTVLTLHNYRLICPGGQLRRGDLICEECLSRKNRGIAQNAPLGSARILWRSGCANKLSSRILQFLFFCETRSPVLRYVDAFVALTDFAKRKFIEGGLPAHKMFVKPNFISTSETEQAPNRTAARSRERTCEAKEKSSDYLSDGANESFYLTNNSNNNQRSVLKLREMAENIDEEIDAIRGKDGKIGAIFVGRLAPEKGVRFLINSWRKVDFMLHMVGDGPEFDWARRNAPINVRFWGERSKFETLELLKKANFLVFPSVWYEGFPMTLLEASAQGVPAVASDLGGRSEVVVDGETGLLFESKNEKSFLNAVFRLIKSPNFAENLGANAKKRCELLFSPSRNYQTLTDIYRKILEES